MPFFSVFEPCLFLSQHEKFTSQLQLSQKSSEIEGSKSISSKGTEPKVSGDMTEMHHKATEALKSEEKSMGEKFMHQLIL